MLTTTKNLQNVNLLKKRLHDEIESHAQNSMILHLPKGLNSNFNIILKQNFSNPLPDSIKLSFRKKYVSKRITANLPACKF